MNHETEHENCPGNDGAFSNGDGSTSAFAHGGYGMWQQNAAPLTSEQQTAWQKIHNDFYAQSSAPQQQLVTKRYEYEMPC